MPSNKLTRAKKLNYLLTAIKEIEEITSSDFMVDLEFALFQKKADLTGDKLVMAKMLIKIYKISHAFNYTNSCFSVHKNWRDEVIKN